MYTVSPRESDRYYLRLLLNNVKGATGYSDLKTYNFYLHKTFGEACLARGLIKDDDEWDKCLAEAVEYKMPSVLRNLFVTILIHCAPSHPDHLWLKYKKELSEDFQKKI